MLDITTKIGKVIAKSLDLNESMRDYSADLNNEIFYDDMSKMDARNAIDNIIQQISKKYQVNDTIFEDGGRFSNTDIWSLKIADNKMPFNVVFMNTDDTYDDLYRGNYITSISLLLRCEDDECEYIELSINGIPMFAINPYYKEPYEIFTEDYDIYIIKDEETAKMINHIQEIFFGGIVEEIKKGSYVIDSLSSTFEYRYTEDTSYKYDYEDEPDSLA